MMLITILFTILILFIIGMLVTLEQPWPTLLIPIGIYLAYLIA